MNLVKLEKLLQDMLIYSQLAEGAQEKMFPDIEARILDMLNHIDEQSE